MNQSLVVVGAVLLVIGVVLSIIPFLCLVGIPLAIVGFILLIVGVVQEGAPMRTCLSCGRQIAAHYYVCPYCGRPAAVAPAPAYPVPAPMLPGVAPAPPAQVPLGAPSQPAALPPQQAAVSCPRCGQPLTYVYQYSRWYCSAEGLYPWG